MERKDLAEDQALDRRTCPVYGLEIRRRNLEIELLLPGLGVPVRKDVASQLDELMAQAPSRYLGSPRETSAGPNVRES